MSDERRLLTPTAMLRAFVTLLWLGLVTLAIYVETQFVTPGENELLWAVFVGLAVVAVIASQSAIYSGMTRASEWIAENTGGDADGEGQ